MMSIASLVNDLTGREPPAGLLAAWIGALEGADACLAAYSEDQVNLLKAYAIAHMMVQQGGGEIVTDRSPTGASVTYSQGKGDSTRFLAALRALPGGRCLIGLIEKPNRFAVSIRPCY